MSINLVAGIPCGFCERYLYAPIMQSYASICLHNFHEQCFEGIVKQGFCSKCRVVVTQGLPNTKLEKIAVRIDALVRQFIGSYSPDSFANRLLHEAIKKGDLEIVEMMVAQGASVSDLVQGRSPLYVACKHQHVEVARFLLQKGANVTQKNDLSYISQQDQYWHINDSDEEHNATPLQAAIAERNKVLVEMLVNEYQAPIEEKGLSYLCAAIHAGDEDLGIFFIEKGVDITKKDSFGNTPMRLAVSMGLLQVVKELVRRGVDLKEHDQFATPLHAAATRNPEVLSFLLQNGAKSMINDQWLNMWTPIALAVQEGKADNVQILIKEGADLSIKCDSMSILDLAKKSLRTSEEFYQSHPQYQEEGEKNLEDKRKIISMLQETNYFASEGITLSIPDVPMQPQVRSIILSDGIEVHRALVQQTLYHIRHAMQVAAAEVESVGLDFRIGETLILQDLKGLACHKKGWRPTVNPFCDSIKIMKTHRLLDGQGHLAPMTGSIVREYIVGEGMKIRLEIPKFMLTLENQEEKDH